MTEKSKKQTIKSTQDYDASSNLVDASAPDSNADIEEANHLLDEPTGFIKQNSDYAEDCRCAPDNNLFYEERSNPLCSKGN